MCAVSLAVAAGLCPPVRGDEGWQPEATPNVPRYEAWTGAQAFNRVWSLYTGLTAAPFASIEQDGFRVRVAGGYSAYSYTAQQGPRIFGRASFADFLLGYHKQVGPVTLKAFGGVTAVDHRLEPDDPTAAIRGPGVGAKVALETWWTVSDRVWTALDLSWSSHHDGYGARARLGWRLVPALSVGLEAEAAGNDDGRGARAGGFLRYEWATGELSLSGGLTGDNTPEGARRAGLDTSAPYATATWLTRF